MPALLAPAPLFGYANAFASLGWLLLGLAPRWALTRRGVLSGAWPLALAALYAAALLAHHAGPAGGAGGFGSLAQVRQLFASDWALLAGWVHYLCFDLWLGAWQVQDGQRRGVPHPLLLPGLALTFLAGPVGLLVHCGMRRLAARPPAPHAV